ncbi:hypothetical protein [Maribacter polysaccharolyticus]|nr:hypothetical protein [Maribacter polysaccharolyticus]MDE3741623.1 hypothetical protein [Maribacter polysaccharolyticus]
MKKILIVVMVLTGIIGMGSCEYDDSNDLDLLTPVDSTAAIAVKPQPVN